MATGAGRYQLKFAFRREESRRDKAVRLALTAVLVALSAWLVLSLLHSETDEINIETGRARHRVFVAGIRISERIGETALSSVLRDRPEAPSIGDWRMVRRFATGFSRTSARYPFQDALAQADRVGLLFQALSPDEARRREIASTVLRLWRETGGDAAAEDYIRLVEEEAPGLQQLRPDRR